MDDISSLNTLTSLAPPSQSGRFDPRAENVGAEFESVMVSMLMSTMRKSSFGEGLFPGDKSDTLGGLFDMMISGQIVDSGGIGIREMVNEWLAEQGAG